MTADEEIEPMTYYGDLDGDGLADKESAVTITTAFQILEMDGAGNGQCSAWADLLYAMCKIHGAIGVGYMKIEPARELEDTFAVRNMIWDNGTVSGSGAVAQYPFVKGVDFEEISSDVIGGILGQGSFGSIPFVSDPAKIFSFHNVIWIESTVFDPSYGSSPISSNVFQENLEEFRMYENQTIELYGLKPLHGNSPTIDFRQNQQTNELEIKVSRIKPQPKK